MIYIYALADPRNNQVRYVGKTNSPKKRLASHVYEIHSPSSTGKVKKSWLHDLVAEGVYPTMIILDIVSGDECRVQEQLWIDRLRQSGVELINEKPGSAGQNVVFEREDCRFFAKGSAWHLVLKEKLWCSRKRVPNSCSDITDLSHLCPACANRYYEIIGVAYSIGQVITISP